MWFRRDLRLADNPALCAAIAEADGTGTHPVFVLDPHLLGPSGAARKQFLAGCLDDLDGALDGRLTVVAGDPVEVIPRLAKKVGADAVAVTADFGPYGLERDRAVAAALEAAGRRFVRCGTPYAVEPGTVQTRGGGPYRVYSPFYRAWRDQDWPAPIAAPPRRALEGPIGRRAARPEDTAPADLPPPGEAAARKRLQAFLRHAGRYGDELNPVLQGERFDPDGDYVRRFVPELAGVRGSAVHQPWKLRDGRPLGYPDRIVDHAAERTEALARFAAIRSP